MQEKKVWFLPLKSREKTYVFFTFLITAIFSSFQHEEKMAVIKLITAIFSSSQTITAIFSSCMTSAKFNYRHFFLVLNIR